jgi:hypothetical protein
MAFGLVQLGAAAAHLGEREKAWQILQWLASKYWTKGLGSYHNVGNLFNTDISGGLPYLVTQMLVYSEQGLISLFPATPPEWKQGSIRGLLLRGNVTVQNLQWDSSSIRLHLSTSTGQKIKLQLPFAVRIRKTKNILLKKPDTANYFEFDLPANREVIIEMEKA